MPGLQLDFTNVPDSDIIPSGDYLMRTKQVEHRKTKNGDDMLVFQLQAKEGPNEGRVVFYNMPIMQSTMWRVKRDLKAWNIDVSQFEIRYEFDQAANRNWVLNEEFFQNDVIVSLGEREYNNEKQNDVKSIRPAPAGIL